MGERIWGESYVRRENTALRRAMAALQGREGRVLEVGCGAGRFIRTLKHLRPDLDAHGSDLSVEAIRHAAGYGDGVRYVAASLDDLPYVAGTFDVVLIFDVLEHVHDPARGLAEVCRLLRPGGLLHALVPCEGQPLTLHWFLWRLNRGGDLKERHGAHVQRFTRRGLVRLVREAGLEPRDVTYSMHPLGQVRDVLSYVECEPWFARWHLNGLPYRLLDRGLWAGAFVESTLLRQVGPGAVVAHVSAVKP